ncbi:MAG: sugar kinase [Ancalomicrobiaceae bacterium]|nr:sugar kinase [Ancalomicrobiaceae bacterium]
MTAERTCPAPEALGPTITIGEILVEIMAAVPGDGFLEPLTLVGPYPSGAPAIFIDQVAKMGGGAGIIASVGRDDFGEVNIRRLARDGVDTSAISRSDHLPTGTAFVRYRPDGGRDFVFNIAHSAAGDLAMTDAVRRLIERAGHLHVMGTALSIPRAWPILTAALDTVKRRGGSVSFDPNLRKELMAPEVEQRFETVLAATDLFLPSEEEIFLAGEASDVDAAAAALLARGVREVVVKRGARGATRYSADGTLDRPAFAVAEIDPTGAGDCFGAGYVTARRLGHGPEAALRFAAAAGARNVTLRGPMEGTSTLAELDALMASQRTI